MPLYEGKMVQALDHRAVDITQNAKNLFRPGQQETIPSSAKRDPDRFPVPRYYVKEDPERWRWSDHWVIAFKDITAATNKGSAQIAVEIQHKDPFLANKGVIEHVLAVEDDVVPFDRADLRCLVSLAWSSVDTYAQLISIAQRCSIGA